MSRPDSFFTGVRRERPLSPEEKLEKRFIKPDQTELGRHHLASFEHIRHEGIEEIERFVRSAVHTAGGIEVVAHEVRPSLVKILEERPGRFWHAHGAIDELRARQAAVRKVLEFIDGELLLSNI